MKKIKWVIAAIAVVALIAVGFLAARLWEKNSEPEVSATAIEEELSKCSELATARLDYRGLIKYTDGDIPLINQKSFSMIYDAKIKAGINLEEAEVKVNDNTIEIVLPKPEILDITIDSDSLEFYDEHFAIFNWTDKEDTQKAMGYAMEDAKERAGEAKLLEEASKQAKTAIKALLGAFTEEGGYTVTFSEK